MESSRSTEVVKLLPTTELASRENDKASACSLRWTSFPDVGLSPLSKGRGTCCHAAISVLIQQEAREGAILPRAAVDGTAVQAQPHLVPLEEGQDGVVASRLVVGRSVVGVAGHHHFVVAHQVDVKRHVDGQLQDVEQEDVRAADGAGEAADVGVVHLAQVAVELVEHDGLVQVAWRKVGGAGGGEGHSQGLVQRVELHGQHGGVLVAVGGDWDLHGGDGQGVALARINRRKRSFSVWAAHRGGVTPCN